LTQHSLKGNEKLVAYEQFKDGARIVESVELEPNKGLLGKVFRSDVKALYSYLETLDDEGKLALKQQLSDTKEAKVTTGGKQFALTPDMITIKKVEKKVSGETFTPHVIEPSFGVGRILYAILEQNYFVRSEEDAEDKGSDKSKKGDVKRTVLSLPAHLAPVQCSVLPLLDKDEFNSVIPRIVAALKSERLSSKVDATGQAIGRRYARTDEIGIPFGITIDHKTLEDKTVTLRERDTTVQLRVPIAEVAALIRDLCEGRLVWKDILDSNKYPRHQ